MNATQIAAHCIILFTCKTKASNLAIIMSNASIVGLADKMLTVIKQ